MEVLGWHKKRNPFKQLWWANEGGTELYPVNTLYDPMCIEFNPLYIPNYMALPMAKMQDRGWDMTRLYYADGTGCMWMKKQTAPAEFCDKCGNETKWAEHIEVDINRIKGDDLRTEALAMLAALDKEGEA